MTKEKPKAHVIGIFGAYYNIRDCQTQKEFLAKLRGKLRLGNAEKQKEKHITRNDTRNFLAIGDLVSYLAPVQSDDVAVIEKLHNRKNTFMRMDTHRLQLFAANIDCVVLIATWQNPSFNGGFIDRVLCESFINQLPTVLVVNKFDLAQTKNENEKESFLLAKEKIKVYQDLSITVFDEETLVQGLSSPLQTFLEQQDMQRILLIGQSGVGKSTFLNQVCQKELAATAHTGAAGKGRHTTSNPTLYVWRNATTPKEIIDIPGVREFGLMHRSPQEIRTGFPEMACAQCRFDNCRHVEEPFCQVKEKVEQGTIASFRYQSYLTILQDLKQNFKPRRGDQRLF